MRAVLMPLLGMLLQGSTTLDLQTPVRPEHLRYQRVVSVAAPGSGVACAVLDEAVLAHTAAADHGDLRLFSELPGTAPIEVPFSLTESGPEPLPDTVVAAVNAVAAGGQLRFDLPMPPRAYAEVKLRLQLQNFVATALVEGRDPKTGAHASLGEVPVYDLSAEGLGRWTSLLLAESHWPVLHVVLEVRSPLGEPRTGLSPAMVEGAEVPPSRLRQTRYVPTVHTETVEQKGGLSEALLHVPAHVPVERVLFTLQPGREGNFAREVTVSARADGAPVTDTEALDAGQIAHVSLPSGDPGLQPIRIREDALDATMGATLAAPATVLVAVDNAGRPPLPIRAVTLEMRERQICFFSDREGRYVLRYGDPTLPAPQMDRAGLTLPPEPLVATLGPEMRNPRYQAPARSGSVLHRHPELFWLVLLLCAGAMGGSALHHVQHRRA